MNQQLNPAAQQWYPPHPHVIYKPPPPYSAASPPPYQQPPCYLPTYHQAPPIHYTTQPPVLFYTQHPVVFVHYLLPVADHFPADHFPCFSEMKEVMETPTPTHQKLNSPVPKRPKTPAPARRQFNGGRSCPPRLQRAIRSFRIWRPIKPAPANSQLPPENDKNTTVMIKNIPNSVRRSFLLKCLDEACRKESMEYDFLYLPMDFRTNDNVGYAFVNFTTAESANKFKKVFHGFEWKYVQTESGLMKSPKICEITWAKYQGRDCLKSKFSGTVFYCDTPDYLPVLLDPPRNGMNPNPPSPVVIGEIAKRRLWL